MNQDHDDVENLRARLTRAMFRKVVFPGMDALVAFVPQDSASSSKVKEAVDEVGDGRWFPVSGGWKVKCPYVGQEFNGELFTIEEGGWDHVHCDICNRTIDAGQSCRVSDDEDGHVICEDCFTGMKEAHEA